MTVPASTDQLDKIALKQLTWKPSIIRNLAIEIVEKILLPPYRIWPDEIVLTDVSLTDRHCVGIAWRLLSSAEIIQQTGNYRKSTAPGRNGGAVFEYRLHSRPRAETFLRRNGRTPVAYEQPVLGL